MNTFQPDKIIIAKTAPYKKPDVTAGCIDIGFYLLKDDFGHCQEAFIKVVSGFRINADPILLAGLTQCNKKHITDKLKHNDLVALPNQTIWLCLESRKAVYYGPEAMLNTVQDTTKTQFIKIPPKCIFTTKYTIGDLKTKVILVQTNDELIVVYNGYMFHDVLLYCVYRYGVERVFRAFVAAGIIGSNALMKDYRLYGAGIQPDVYPDFHFSCDGRLIPAHRVMLNQIKYFNVYFASAFYSDHMIMPPLFTPEIVIEVIDLIYNNKIADHKRHHLPLVAMWFGAEIPLLSIV